MRLVFVGLSVCVVAGSLVLTACDEESLSALSPELAKLAGASLSNGELDATGSGGRLQTRDRDRLADGSCAQAATQDQLRSQRRDQLRDGSCWGIPAQDGSGGRAPAGAGIGNGDMLRLHDGSCQSQ